MTSQENILDRIKNNHENTRMQTSQPERDRRLQSRGRFEDMVTTEHLMTMVYEMREMMVVMADRMINIEIGLNEILKVANSDNNPTS